MLHILTSALLLALTGACTGQKTPTEQAETFVPVRRGALVGKRVWFGFVRSSSRVEIRANRRARLLRVAALNGTAVKKGDLLIELDKSESEAKVRELKDRFKTVTLEHSSASVRLGHAARVRGRKSTLLEKGVIPRKEYEEAVRDQRLAETDFRTRQLELEKTQREIDQTSSETGGPGYLAPMDGVVSGLASIDGPGAGEVSAGQLLGVISDTSKLALAVEVPEPHLKDIGIGKEVTLTLDAFPDKALHGKVMDVGTAPLPSGSGAQAAVFEVLVGFDSKGIPVQEGFEGTATLVVAQKDDALAIPLAALRFLEGKELVMASTSPRGPGTARGISTGLRTDGEIEVTGGVTEKDFVAVETKK